MRIKVFGDFSFWHFILLALLIPIILSISLLVILFIFIPIGLFAILAGQFYWLRFKIFHRPMSSQKPPIPRLMKSLTQGNEDEI